VNRRPSLPLVLLLALAVVATACAGPAGRDAIQLTAAFDDVGDLVRNAHVRAGTSRSVWSRTSSSPTTSGRW
jgi:hypothetical protein